MTLHHIFTSVTLSLFLSAVTVAPDRSALAENAPQTMTTQQDVVIPQWLQPLKLTTAQVQKMKTIRNKHQASILQNSLKLRQAQQELELLLVSGAPDDQMREKYRQVQIQKYRLDNARFEVTLEMQDVLSSQQRQMLAELNKKRLANLKSRINNSNVEQ